MDNRDEEFNALYKVLCSLSANNTSITKKTVSELIDSVVAPSKDKVIVKEKAKKSNKKPNDAHTLIIDDTVKTINACKFCNNTFLSIEDYRMHYTFLSPCNARAIDEWLCYKANAL
jgi:hypothetical protein